MRATKRTWLRPRRAGIIWATLAELGSLGLHLEILVKCQESNRPGCVPSPLPSLSYPESSILSQFLESCVARQMNWTCFSSASRFLSFINLFLK